MARYRAQTGGVMGSGLYPQVNTGVDVGGAIDAIASALAGRREGMIRKAMMQREIERQDKADAYLAEDRTIAAAERERTNARQDRLDAQSTEAHDAALAKQAEEMAAKRAELGIVPDRYAPAPTAGADLAASVQVPSIRQAYQSGGSAVGQFQAPAAANPPAPSVGTLPSYQLLPGFQDKTLGTKYQEKQAAHEQARTDKRDDMATALANAKVLAEFQAGLRAKNSKTPKLGGQSDFSRKADFMLPGAIQAVETINAWEDRNGGQAPSVAGKLSRVLGGTGNYTTPEDLQVLNQSAAILADSYLRLTTGASINPEEAKNAALQMLPQPGDKPAVLKAKRARRKVVLEALTRAAAPTAAHEPDALAPQPPDLISQYGLEP
jgi:hypothetical protein